MIGVCTFEFGSFPGHPSLDFLWAKISRVSQASICLMHNVGGFVGSAREARRGNLRLLLPMLLWLWLVLLLLLLDNGPPS